MNPGSFAALAAGVRGAVVTPADDGYDQARRVWNGKVDKRPAAVVTCLDTADVVEAVGFARTHDLGISVRSAGHHVAGSAVLDGGLVVDVSQLRGVEVDPSRQRVRAQGGAQIGDVDRATQAHGLAVPLGVVSETGVAGLTLAGGYGWLRRKHGLSCDNVVAAEVVTAAGDVLEVDAASHPDLFWALRGGGWDLGVVTALEYRAHPVGPDVHLTFLTFALAEGATVLARLREFAHEAPPGFGALAVCWTFPDAEPFPTQLWGQPFVGIAGPFAGPVADGEAVRAHLSGFGTPLTDLSAVVPWLEAQTFFDEDYPRGRRYHWKSAHLRELDDQAIATLLDSAARRPSQLTSLDIWVNGGAIAEVPADATPVGNRDAPFMIGVEANWDDPAADADNVAWARETTAALQPQSSGGAYLNFDDLSDPTVVRASHGVNFDRLARVKQRYDHGNRFRSRGRVG